jgi:hypothetical protein
VSGGGAGETVIEKLGFKLPIHKIYVSGPAVRSTHSQALLSPTGLKEFAFSGRILWLITPVPGVTISLQLT